jgi:hypothetical protein
MYKKANMPIPRQQQRQAAQARSLTVANYRFPALDPGIVNAAIVTDGVGNLSFGPVSSSGGVLGAGSGVDNRIVRWDGSIAIQSSAVTLDDSGNLTGIVNITASGTAILTGLTYPSTDGASGNAIITDGAGNLSFGAVSGSGVVQGAGVGVDNRVTRWDGSVAIQSSAVTLDDSGNLTGIVNITASGTVILTGLTYPSTDGASGSVLITNGAGMLSFAPVSSSGGVLGAGSGVDNRVTRWDGSVAIQSSAVTLDDSGNLTGIVNITVSGTAILTGLTYPITDGTAGQSIVTDGAGTLSFASGMGISGGITVPASVDNRITRYNGTTALQGSLITVDDSNNISATGGLGIQNSGFFTVMTTSSGSVIFGGAQNELIDVGDCAIISCQDSTITHSGTGSNRWSAIMGSLNCDIRSVDADGVANNFIAGSVACDIDTSGVSSGGGNRNAIIASATSVLRAGMLQSTVISSLDVNIGPNTGVNTGTHEQCVIVGSVNCDMNDASGLLHQCMLASNNIDNSGVGLDNVVFGGVDTRNWLINGATGEFMGSAFTVANPVPDYAEYFENHMQGSAIPYGTLVALEGDKVRVATASDDGTDILGIVSSNPAVRAGGSEMHWQGSHLRNDWNQLVFENVADTSWRRGPGQTERDRPISRRPKINPDYKPNESVYVDRGKRPKEWTCVGLLGQILTRVDDTVSPTDYVAPGVAGVGTKSLTRTKVRCMRLHRSNMEEEGKTYNIALCLFHSVFIHE